jgi:ligand-binding SRPBCC domain-containing protein
MPVFQATVCLPRPTAEVFDFFRRPANLIRISPPDFHLRLVEAPEVLELGSRLTLQGRRWGIPQRIVSEVTALEQEALMVDEQREGPFGKWVHTHRFEAVPEGTRVTDEIDYAAPGGLLGLVVSERFIASDLEWIFQYRTEKLKELLGAGS